MHLSDDIARLGTTEATGPFQGAWPKKPTQTHPRHPARHTAPYTAPCDIQAADATNMSLYEHGTLQPEDL